MGILLIGIVAALFFRNEPLPEEGTGLTAAREQQLNQSLRDRNAPIYLDDSDAHLTTQTEIDAPAWSLPEVFSQMKQNDSVPAPIGLPAVKKSEKLAEASPKIEPPKTPSTQLTPADDPSIEIAADQTKPVNEFKDLLSGTKKANDPKRTDDTSGQFTEYVVQYGDTLSGISEKFLGSQARYKEIYKANRDRMASPDRLKVGKAIRIPRQRH